MALCERAFGSIILVISAIVKAEITYFHIFIA